MYEFLVEASGIEWTISSSKRSHLAANRSADSEHEDAGGIPGPDGVLRGFALLLSCSAASRR